MADYTIINYVISYNLFNKLKLYARFENLLNREYEEIYGFGTPGFSIYGGVKIDTNDIFK
jgi:vitamin B12 transporter